MEEGLLRWRVCTRGERIDLFGIELIDLFGIQDIGFACKETPCFVQASTMPRIVAVHGIAQQLKGPESLRSEWLAPMADGLRLANDTLSSETVAFAFYGGLFRGPELTRSVGAGASHCGGCDDGAAEFDGELLAKLWQAAAEAYPTQVFSPDSITRGTPQAAQAALRALARLPFFAGIASSLMAGDLQQVRRYMSESAIRGAAQQSIDAVMTPECSVVVAHSLGSVVAYEALHRYADAPNWAHVTTLVTLGSPLGIRNLIFDALQPPPQGGQGRWPALLRRWINISDNGDVVALEKKLSTRFGSQVVDIGIDNGATVHNIAPYLTAAATGRAIASGLG